MINKAFKQGKYMYIRGIIALLVLIILFFFSTSTNKMVTSYHHQNQDDARNDFYMAQGDRIEQTICFQKDYINRIGICILNKTAMSKGKIEIQLFDSQNNITLLDEEVDIKSVQLQKFIWFDIKETINVGQPYLLTITSGQLEGELYILMRSAEDNELNELQQTATEYGVDLAQKLAINFEYKSAIDIQTKVCMWVIGLMVIIYLLGFEQLFMTPQRKRITIFGTIILMILPLFYSYCVPNHDKFHTKLYILMGIYYIFLLGISVFVIYKKKSIVKLFVITMLFNGLIYSFVFAPFSQPDEVTHFYESYRLSNKILGQQINDEDGNVLVRECDLQSKERDITDSYITNIIYQFKSDVGSEKIVSSDFIGPIKAPVVAYLPQAIGISFARLLHLNYYQLCYLGRITNLLFFIIIVAISIYIIPYGKWQIFVICNIPYLMQLIPSYSYDTLIIAGSILLVSYIVKLCSQEKRVSILQYLCLLAICLFFANFKPIYFPLLGIVLIIQNNKLSDNKIKAILLKAVLIIFSVGMMLLVYTQNTFLNMYSLCNTSVSKIDTSIVAEANDNWLVTEDKEFIYYSSYQEYPDIRYLINNPFDFIDKFITTLISLTDWHVLSLFGNYMGSNEIRVPIMLTLLMMLLFISEMKNKDNEIYNQRMVYCQRWIYLLNFISVFGTLLVSYLQWSTIERSILGGIQGRYFLPLLSSFIIGRNTKGVLLEKKTTVVYIFIIIHMLTLLYSCNVIWNR